MFINTSTGFTCNLQTTLQDLPNLAWEAQAGGGFGNAFLSHLLHSKVFIFLADISRCYFRLLSPEVVVGWFSLIGGFLYLVGIYFLVSKKNWAGLAVVVLSPVSIILGFWTGLSYWVAIGVIVYGFYSLVWRKKLS